MRYCLITGTTKPVLGKKKIVTFAADHGVVAEGVSAFPQEVTPQMVRNMLAGGAAVNVLARHAHADVDVVDIGVNDPLDNAPGLISKKIKNGSDNMAVGPAMSLNDTYAAMQVGADIAIAAALDGYTLIGTGEMGIGNTTPSAALFAVMLPCSVEEITGRGTGISDDVLLRKINIIQQSISVNAAITIDPISTLAALGGFEIAGICGLILGAASQKVPVVVDGFISSAAALAACRICPAVSGYLYFSHCSAEQGHATFFRLFNVKPVLDLKMRLGEGTGAALAMQIIEGGVKVYNQMSTFSSAGVSNKDD
jgi:nicotinate-nucleotide--dimethylbenzimidazole phosphoribosyltransferase